MSAIFSYVSSPSFQIVKLKTEEEALAVGMKKAIDDKDYEKVSMLLLRTRAKVDEIKGVQETVRAFPPRPCGCSLSLMVAISD